MSNIINISGTCDSIINILQRAFKELTENSSVQEKEKWIKFIKNNIRLLNKAIKVCDYEAGTLKKIQTSLGYLQYIKSKINNLSNFVHSGEGVREKRSNRVKWEDIKSAFKSRIRTAIILNLKHKDLSDYFNDAFFLFKSRIRNILKRLHTIKVNTIFCAEFIMKRGDEEVTENKYFPTKNAVIDMGTNLKIWFNEFVIDKIKNKLEEFQESGSGGALNSIIGLEVNINQYEIGLGASSYIELPKQIANKKACINVKNSDHSCFVWSIVSALWPANSHTDRTSSYPDYRNVLNLTGIEFPMTFKQIPKFENLNNISVNVFALEVNKKSMFTVVPVLLTKNRQINRHVNLLLIQNNYDLQQDDNNNKIEISYHYCWIKDLSKLISSQTSKNKQKLFICDRCLNYFLNQEKLNDHIVYCETMNDCKICFPVEKYISFKNYNHKEKLPFILYADFESILLPFNESQDITNKTCRYQKHEAYSVGYYFKAIYDNSKSYYRSYTGLDCTIWFANELDHISEYVYSILKHIEPMNTKVNIKDATSNCHICEKPFQSDDKIVRDHSHISGDFRGFAHVGCNLNYRNSFIVPCFLHNLTGYDAHFLIRDLAKRDKVTVLPCNKEKYISFTKHSKGDTNIKFRFVDSFRFLGFSLEKLVSFLDKAELLNLKNEFQHLDDEKFNLLTRKGIFCYDFVDNIDKLSLTHLPPIENFYNLLNDENITEEDYIHAQNVWEAFNCQNLGQYSELYLKTDVILLADVFENYRARCHQIYGLDPAFYYTLPGYTWDCMLKYTGCCLETVQDVDILLFIERGVRGGLSQCCNRYSVANNKYMTNYNPIVPSKYLLYFDVNNLYGWAMCQSLPYGGFEWVTDVENFNVSEVSDDSAVGYFLEVDLYYPEHLHDLHRDLPMCPEHRVPPNSKLPKLMATLYAKEKYVIHYRNLKQCLRYGIVLEKIHKILRFKQSAFLKPYVELNTRLRSQAKNEFDKQTFKLQTNGVFGKTMENIRKHRIVKLINKWEQRYGAKNLISRPDFHSIMIFDENLVAVEMKKTNIVFNKPLYIGMAILDISKTCVYDFHYEYMLKDFDLNSCKLLYTDTDSLIYELQCDDAYQEVIRRKLERFDTSDYNPNNPYNIPLVNKKVVGIMKDENNGNIMTHFIGLRSKQYAFLIQENKKEKCVKKSKGIKKNIIKKNNFQRLQRLFV